MTFHQLEMFSAIARHGNVSRAASELHLSQPSITYQIKLLEQELGTKLYRKVLSGVELTENGQQLLPHAELVIRQMEAIANKFGRSRSAILLSPLTIGGSSGMAAWFLPSLISRFQRLHPQVEVTLRVESSLTMEKMVQSGEVEIAVVTDHSNAPDLVYEPCRREKLVFFGVREGKFTRPEIPLKDLAKVPFILYKKGKAGASAKFFDQVARAGVQANVALRCESVEAVKSAVRQGSGLGLLYRDNLRSEISRGEMQVIQVPGLEVRIDSSIVYPRRKLSPAAEEFLRLLRERRSEAKAAARRERLAKKIALKVLTLAPLAGWLYPLIGEFIDTADLVGSALI